MVLGLLIAVVSLVAEHKLQMHAASCMPLHATLGLRSFGSGTLE